MFNNRWRILVSVAVLFVAGLVGVEQVRADSERHLPDPRPDSRSCLPVPGGIPGMVQDVSGAGTTYYTSTHTAQLVTTLNLAPPFVVDLYDADGPPNTTLDFVGAETLTFTGTQNAWSMQNLPIVKAFTGLIIGFPLNHGSTHVCVFKETAPTGAPAATEPQIHFVYLPLGANNR
jgi:hypothetical protein